MSTQERCAARYPMYGVMDNETKIATAALATAIAALIIAAGQLIALLFSTADGYRRCQSSVIGHWYKLVGLSFRWTSLRYEVKVTTPHFQIATMSDCEHRTSFLLDNKKPLPKFPSSLVRRKSQYLVPPGTPAPLLGTDDSRLGTFCQPAASESCNGQPADRVRTRENPWTCIDVGEDVPTWFDLLEDVHQFQYDFAFRLRPSYSSHLAPICISRKTRSWDFMPPDIVRPVASTTVGCLITMAHRLGMTWTDFRLDEGKMRAMGGGRSFSTSVVRGMGLVVEYSTTAHSNLWQSTRRIPSIPADKMACGIIPTTIPTFHDYYTLRLRDKQVPTTLSFGDSMSVLGINGDAKVALEASMSRQDPAHRLPAFTDIIGLLSPWMPIDGIARNAIDNPFPFPLTTMGERPESRNVWRLLLKSRETQLSDRLKHILQFYESWEHLNFSEFAKGYRLNATDFRQLEFFKKAFADATVYLEDTLGVIYGSIYRQAVRCHVSINAHSVDKALGYINSLDHQPRRDGLLPANLDPILTERAYIYAGNVLEFVQKMEKSRHHDPRKNISYEDVWWTMMMRLHAWTMSVRWVDREGVQIPSKYYDHPARVYIL